MKEDLTLANLIENWLRNDKRLRDHFGIYTICSDFIIQNCMSSEPEANQTLAVLRNNELLTNHSTILSSYDPDFFKDLRKYLIKQHNYSKCRNRETWQKP